MRSFIVVVAGLTMGSLPISALENALPQTAIPYNGEALRTAIADGMSRAGATLVRAESGAGDIRH